MPALSPTMTEGILQKWLVKVGDEVKAGDVLAEIETDKATMEIEAVDEGIITDILVKEGAEGVSVNSPIAILQSSIKDETDKIGRKKQTKKSKIDNKNNILQQKVIDTDKGPPSTKKIITKKNS